MAPLGTLYSTGEYIHPRTRKILAAARIGGLELDKPTDFTPYGDNKKPEYLAKFPLGKIPAFESASGDFRVYESQAIAEYVCRKGTARDQLLGETSDEAAILVRQWICFNAAHVGETLWPIVGWRGGFLPYDAEKDKKGEEDMARWLRHIENHLAGVDEGGNKRKWFVGGEKLSLADLAVGESIHVLLTYYLDKELRQQYPATLAWYERLTAAEGMEDLYKVALLEARKTPEEAPKPASY